MTSHRIHTAGNTRPWRFGTVRDRSAIPGPLANDNGVSWRRLLGEALLIGTGIVGVVLALVALGD